jgi:hypothetical protein
MPVTEADIEQRIKEWFETNYERIKADTGHALTLDIRKTALEQVLIYWRKLRATAEAVTETEVRLNLPNQHTPKPRTFCIEGVVDIVKDADKTAMYDLKTHDERTVRDDIEFYREQLNVYAHIWRNLHGRQLDETAVIATQVPEAVRRAWRARDELALQKALDGWNPVVDIPFDDKQVEETVRRFGEVVDLIQDGCFQPPPVKRLREREGKMNFATRVCRNCDARHSCPSYREYAQAPARRDSIRMREFYDDVGDLEEHGEWKDSALEAAPDGGPAD